MKWKLCILALCAFTCACSNTSVLYIKIVDANDKRALNDCGVRWREEHHSGLFRQSNIEHTQQSTGYDGIAGPMTIQTYRRNHIFLINSDSHCDAILVYFYRNRQFAYTSPALDAALLATNFTSLHKTNVIVVPLISK